MTETPPVPSGAVKCARYHVLERTSPKGPGMPFIGTCIQCGRTNLPGTAVFEECDNIRGNTEDESLIEMITGGRDDK